jgi:hypothetical protein
MVRILWTSEARLGLDGRGGIRLTSRGDDRFPLGRPRVTPPPHRVRATRPEPDRRPRPARAGRKEDGPLDRSVARRLLAAGLLIGVLAEVVLDGPAYGLNVLLVVAALLGAGWLLRRRDRAPDPLDAWLPITAVALAAFVAVRGDPFMALVDALGALTFTGASLVAFSGLPVTRRSASVVAVMAAMTLEATVAGAARAIRASGPTDSLRSIRVATAVGPIGRGLFLALPIAVIFATLFASADPIFRRTMADLLGWQLDLGGLPGQVLFVAACSWLAAGLLSVSAVGIPEVSRSSLGAAARTGIVVPAGRLGATEAFIVLVVIDSVVGLFVGLQVAYLFGGQNTLVAAGMTYSDYARRGFFELVAAACLAGAVVVVLEAIVARRTRPYLVALVGLLALTAVVLVSAGLRLRLYQDAYGWTELRLYVLTTIVSLAASLVLMTGLALADRMRRLGHGLAVIGVVALMVLNVLAPSAFVAARNVERVIDPTLVAPGGHAGLDATYLGVLPDDAVPILVEALPGLPAPERQAVLAILHERKTELATDPAFASPAAWNLGREQAKASLATLP